MEIILRERNPILIYYYQNKNVVTIRRHETDKYTYDQRNSSSKNSHENDIKKCRQRLEKQRNRETEEREIPREQQWQ